MSSKKPTGKRSRTPKRVHGSKTEPIRKITKTGKYTFYITIPKAELEALGWRERQKVVVKRVGKKLVIEDWSPVERR